MKPEFPRFIIQTLGCKVNQYESQALSEQLMRLGFLPAADDEPCDFVILNTCAVTAESVRKARQMTRRAHKQHPRAHILITGCAAQMQSDLFTELEGVSYLCGTRNKNSITEAAKALWNMESPLSEYRKTVCILPPEGKIENMRIAHFDRTRAYVKIQDGCNGKCAYCIISTLRGTSCSRPQESIIEEVTELAKGGCREVVLTGIETSAYEYDLADLIAKIDTIPGIQRIRLGSLDPSFMKPEFVDRISEIPSVAPHFHLSLQSGSDSVLKRMRRRYLICTALEHIDYLRLRMPSVQFSTDLIVGFPGETEDEFGETLRVAREIGFLHIHVFPYSKRPGTTAATLPNQIPEAVKAERVRRLTLQSDETRDRILRSLVDEGKPLSVLVETCTDRIAAGHSAQFAEVHFEMIGPASRGEMVEVLPLAVKDGAIIGQHQLK